MFSQNPWPQHQSPFGVSGGCCSYMVFISEMVLLSLAVRGGTGGAAGALDFRDIGLAWVEGYQTVSRATVPGTLCPPRLPLPGESTRGSCLLTCPGPRRGASILFKFTPDISVWASRGQVYTTSAQPPYNPRLRIPGAHSKQTALHSTPHHLSPSAPGLEPSSFNTSSPSLSLYSFSFHLIG